MCMPKPKRDPAIDELTRQQKARLEEERAEIQAGIAREKEEDKEQAVTTREGMKMSKRGAGRGRRRTMLSVGGYSPNNFGAGRFS